MLPRVVLCDFDGTIVPEDVSEELLASHGSPEWWEIDLAFQRGEIGSRECAERQVALLRAGREELLASALERFAVDPSFPPFVEWCRSREIEVAVVSDGFGFYIEPMLAAAGVAGLPIITNESIFDGGPPRLAFLFGHGECVGCGTCKMRAVLEARQRTGGPVAFVGEGHTDRYGAIYADVVFATKHLAEICRSSGIPFAPWETFDDVRRGLERSVGSLGRAVPEVCPGWTEPEPA
jgi:2-hydroxy-3-keto-5-methylthiopentenyl-1-phosphate phosphatase